MKILLMGLLLAVTGVVMAQSGLQQIKPMTPAINSIVVDYKAQYEKQIEKNKQLRAENDALKAQIAGFTQLGGSTVTAYCANPATSQNTAGASNDCSASGYTCEPVSGLCRTRAANSLECAAGYTYCAMHSSCVTSAAACQ